MATLQRSPKTDNSRARLRVLDHDHDQVDDAVLIDYPSDLDYDDMTDAPLARWLHGQVAAMRTRHDPRFGWLAAKVEEIETLARILHAATPDQYEDRAEALGRDL